MKIKWEVDDATVVEARTRAFGRSILTVNGTQVPGRLSTRRKSDVPFDLSGGRHAVVLVRPQFLGSVVIDLRVDGQLMVATGKLPIKCGSCGATVRPNDRFCGSCGQSMPPAENYAHQRRLNEATAIIWVLAALFSISGIVLFFVTKSQVNTALSKIEWMSAETLLPVNGVTYTVAALRDRLVWEPWSALIVNLVLAAVMAGLALWGKRAPLAAILIATATYAVVTVTNAIISPQSIAQGIIMKIVIILFFVRGIKGALALRAANA